MKALKNTLAKKIKASLPKQIGLPELNQEKTVLGVWGKEQIEKMNWLGQELVTMRMG